MNRATGLATLALRSPLRTSVLRRRTQPVGMEALVAVCQDCEWEQPMPSRDTAEHAKRVHENEYHHTVILEA